MASERFNMRNPAVKRILQARKRAVTPRHRGWRARRVLSGARAQELKELQACGSRDFAATVLEVRRAGPGPGQQTSHPAPRA